MDKPEVEGRFKGQPSKTIYEGIDDQKASERIEDVDMLIPSTSRR